MLSKEQSLRTLRYLNQLQIEVCQDKLMNTADVLQFWSEKDDYNIAIGNRHPNLYAVKELKFWFIRPATTNS